MYFDGREMDDICGLLVANVEGLLDSVRDVIAGRKEALPLHDLLAIDQLLSEELRAVGVTVYTLSEVGIRK